MKCPFRKSIMNNRFVIGANGRELIQCFPSEAHLTTEGFEDCYAGECMAYSFEEGCLRLEREVIEKSDPAAYEATKLEPEQVEKLLKIAKAIIRDSYPFEGDKILCHIAAIQHLFATVESKVS